MVLAQPAEVALPAAEHHEAGAVFHAFFEVREVGVAQVFGRVVAQNVNGVLGFEEVRAGFLIAVHAVKFNPEMGHDPGKVRGGAKDGIVAEVADFGGRLHRFPP